ncbi:antitoxin MazE family protein [Chlorobium sp. BLA1]|nr:antitoxin MazE family protein [Candidatus Chlorobium masyuteum]NTU45314.1 antitoxin MazE family protein [Chlorobiaceae bacterium]
MGEGIERVNKHRARLRKEGMRPLQIWVPDPLRPGFAEECRRQSEVVKNDPHEKEILKFFDEAADKEGWRA